MPDYNAGAAGDGAGIDPLFRLGVAEAFANFTIARGEAISAWLRSKKEEWVDDWDDPTEFKAVEKEGDNPGSGDAFLTIEREDDGSLFLLIEELVGDYAMIRLSADQVAALRQWLEYP